MKEVKGRTSYNFIEDELSCISCTSRTVRSLLDAAIRGCSFTLFMDALRLGLCDVVLSAGNLLMHRRTRKASMNYYMGICMSDSARGVETRERAHAVVVSLRNAPLFQWKKALTHFFFSLSPGCCAGTSTVCRKRMRSGGTWSSGSCFFLSCFCSRSCCGVYRSVVEMDCTYRSSRAFCACRDFVRGWGEGHAGMSLSSLDHDLTVNDKGCKEDRRR